MQNQMQLWKKKEIVQIPREYLWFAFNTEFKYCENGIIKQAANHIRKKKHTALWIRQRNENVAHI